MLFDNRILGTISSFEGEEEMRGKWTKLHNNTFTVCTVLPMRY
jgi:hypothetical protein